MLVYFCHFSHFILLLIDKFAEGFVHADLLASSLEKAWLSLHVQVSCAGICYIRILFKSVSF